MKVLGLDCAGNSCSVAVLIDREAVAARRTSTERGQAEVLLPMIEATLAEARLDIGALDLIAVTVGPGSFTGVRTGLAAARGLALASGRPLIGVTCFAAVAEAVAGETGEQPLVVALESRREELFLQRFDRADPGEPALVAASAWRNYAPGVPFLIAGDAADRFAAGVARDDSRIVRHDAHSNAVAAARLGAAQWKSGTRAPPAPLYLRVPDVTVPPPQGRRTP